MENDFDFCARRAAEEFLAAGRAATHAERMAHRQLAEKYAEVVRQLLDQRKAKIAWAPSDEPPAQSDPDAQAA